MFGDSCGEGVPRNCRFSAGGGVSCFREEESESDGKEGAGVGIEAADSCFVGDSTVVEGREMDCLADCVGEKTSSRCLIGDGL